MKLAQERVQLLTTVAQLQKSSVAFSQTVKEGNALVRKGMMFGTTALFTRFLLRFFRREPDVVDMFYSSHPGGRRRLAVKLVLSFLVPVVRRKLFGPPETTPRRRGVLRRLIGGLL